MRANVFITLWKDGRIIHKHAGHNVWVDTGRAYLAQLVTDTPESRRVKHIGVGIGGVKQNQPTIADAPPVSTAYPAGADPNATSGNEYSAALPVSPPISTLERPVRITGGTTPYPGDPADVWLTQPSSLGFFNAKGGIGQMVFHSFIDAAGGELVYGPFTQMPLSEIGLFLSGADVNDAFNQGELVAYHSFDTIVVPVGVLIEFVWQVGF